MTDKETSYRIAQDYVTAVMAGDLPDAMLTPDMTAWITTAGTVSKQSYQRMIQMMKVMCATPLVFTVQAMTADEDRVVIEVTSAATLVSGEDYRQTYVFVLRLRDGKIAAVAEHYNALVAQEKLLPLMATAKAKIADQAC